ncbi:unnamed protein product [Psylliodes chrysocephalus]|uniref:Uncharacterized protein n=1 Tax=Psylliodes chrysocephalus TaxID=3402493 RepID=A0A9P0C9N8_9CUCU|nr:unnamed protein product [Psylliodes chrysocephala]
MRQPSFETSSIDSTIPRNRLRNKLDTNDHEGGVQTGKIEIADAAIQSEKNTDGNKHEIKEDVDDYDEDSDENENIHSTESIDKQYKQNGKRYEQNRYSEESLDLDKNPDKNEIQINDKDEMAKELRENNDKICNYICNLKSQREELIYIIEKQYDERKRLETEMERITYKLCLINKSMAQRIKTKNLYDQTLQEVEGNYSKLVKDSGIILSLIQSQYESLDEMINKKTNTDQTLLTPQHERPGGGGEHPDQQNKVCTCHIKMNDSMDRNRKPRKQERHCTCTKIVKQDDSD